MAEAHAKREEQEERQRTTSQQEEAAQGQKAKEYLRMRRADKIEKTVGSHHKNAVKES